LHELLGRPLVCYPSSSRARSAPIRSSRVLGHQHEAVEAALLARFGADSVTVVESDRTARHRPRRRLAMPALARVADGMVLVLYGDVPLLRRETLRRAGRHGAALRLPGAGDGHAADATGYGRILRDERGHVIGVVEQKDASPDERAITEINAGIYCGPADFFREAVLGLGTGNAQGEYYLTDVVARAARGIGVSAVEAAFADVCGINDREQLARRGDAARADKPRLAGARHVPRSASTVVEPGVDIGVDVELGRNVSLRGRTRIGHGARIDDGCVLIRHRGRRRRAVQALLHRHRHGDRTGAIIGPFAHMRPGTQLGPDVHLGNFVETKKTGDRPRQQGQPPQLSRRHHHRREGQRRRRHHHLQLRRLQEVPDRHRGRRVHRLGHAADRARCAWASGR
jgi:bifunctional UDP-N-acetylglucosamine pyrophosphorylase/glucosamine-1-phosphate N-acetyltransferase